MAELTPLPMDDFDSNNTPPSPGTDSSDTTDHDMDVFDATLSSL